MSSSMVSLNLSESNLTRGLNIVHQSGIALDFGEQKRPNLTLTVSVKGDEWTKPSMEKIKVDSNAKMPFMLQGKTLPSEIKYVL